MNEPVEKLPRGKNWRSAERAAQGIERRLDLEHHRPLTVKLQELPYHLHARVVRGTEQKLASGFRYEVVVSIQPASQEIARVFAGLGPQQLAQRVAEQVSDGMAWRSHFDHGETFDVTGGKVVEKKDQRTEITIAFSLPKHLLKVPEPR